MITAQNTFGKLLDDQLDFGLDLENEFEEESNEATAANVEEGIRNPQPGTSGFRNIPSPGDGRDNSDSDQSDQSDQQNDQSRDDPYRLRERTISAESLGMKKRKNKKKGP